MSVGENLSFSKRLIFLGPVASKVEQKTWNVSKAEIQAAWHLI